MASLILSLIAGILIGYLIAKILVLLWKIARLYFSREVLPEPYLGAVWTDSQHYGYWAEIYQVNAPLRTQPFWSFASDPQHQVQELLTLPAVNLNRIEPLLPKQAIAAAAIYLSEHDESGLPLTPAESETNSLDSENSGTTWREPAYIHPQSIAGGTSNGCA